MKVSVVICTRDRHEMIADTLESVLDCEYDDFDLHVMDQSTSDRTKLAVEATRLSHPQGSRINYHHLSVAGLSRSYNAGMRCTDGEIIAFTDDDCLLPRNWLRKIADAFTQEPEVDLLYGQVLIPAKLWPQAKTGEIIVPNLPIDRREVLQKGKGFKVFGMGANMAIRRSLLERVEGFDEALGGGGPLRSSQDFDFAYRVYLTGRAILLDPEVQADHYGIRTAEQWPITMQNYGIGDGAFYGKHIRCGDLYALRLFISKVVLSKARELRSLIRGKFKPDLYGRFLWTGLRDGRKFSIDPKFRIYRETEQGRMTVTQANVVTAARIDKSEP